MTGRGWREKGYTLIELVVVMALLAIILGVSVPRFRTALLSDQLMASSRRLVGVINGVRAEAVRKYSDYQLSFDFDGRRVSYSRLASDAEHGEGAKGFPLPEGIRIVDIWSQRSGKQDAGEAFLLLNRKGYAEPAVIHLAEEDGRTVTLFISPFLARVRIAEGYQEMEGVEE